jgi:hypothetical protein
VESLVESRGREHCGFIKEPAFEVIADMLTDSQVEAIIGQTLSSYGPEMMREGDFTTHFIIGHENSFWHGKAKFSLES